MMSWIKLTRSSLGTASQRGLWKRLLCRFVHEQASASQVSQFLPADEKSREGSGSEVSEVCNDIETFIDDKIKQRNAEGSEVPFFVASLDDVFEKHERWKALLPRVTPFYAVKCNNTAAVLRLLGQLGTGFDCASKKEIEMVLALGVTPDRIIYAHTTKPQSHIRHARARGVDTMTFDNEEELLKITAAHPGAKLVLRIAVDDSKSLAPFSSKFGAPLASVGGLLKQARELHLDVRGVSFHVGSCCTDAGAYTKAIEDARQVFDRASFLGFQMDLLDIGGGFIGPELKMMAIAINQTLDEFFPAHSGVKIIAEPGCYFVDSAFTLAMNVFAKKKVWNHPISRKDDSGLHTLIMYYVTDGIYGSFLNLSTYPEIKLFSLRPHRLPAVSREPGFPSVVWGPTCDSADRITDVRMPELSVGDWILVDNIGAYSHVFSTDFNGFEKPNIYPVLTARLRNLFNRKM